MSELVAFFKEYLWNSSIQKADENEENDDKKRVEREMPNEETVDMITKIKSLVYSILEKNKDDEFSRHKMCVLVDRPVITLGSIGAILRDLWREEKIVRRSSEKGGMIYKVKAEITISYKETLKFFNNSQILKKIKIEKNSLVMGAVQSGKTKLIISYAYQSFLRSISTVILVLPTNENENQIRSRFYDNDEYIRYMTSLGLDPMSLPVPIRATNDTDELEDLLTGTTPGIVILLCNPSKMTRLVNIIEDIGKSKFNLVIDEIDSFYKSKDERKFHEPFKFLINSALSVVGVTATIFDVVLPNKSNFVTNENIHLMDIPSDYKGFSDLRWIELEDVKIKTDEISNLGIDSFYSSLLETPPYKLREGREAERGDAERGDAERGDIDSTHPLICLHKVDRKNDDQENTQYYFKKKFPELCSIVYNGRGVYLYYKILSRLKSLVVDDVEIGVDCGVFRVDTSISRILGWLRNNKSFPPPTHIVIIAGKMADRGISFVSSDYKWHLTHELMIVSSTTTSGSLLQGVRICGRYSDNIPLHIITDKKTYDDLIKSSKTQDEIYIQSKNMVGDDYINNLLSGMKLSDDIVMTGRRLCVNEYNKIKSDSKPNDTTGEYFVITRDMYKSYKKVFEEVVILFKTGNFEGWIFRTDVIDLLISLKINDMNSQGYKTVFENQAKKKKMSSDDSTPGILMMRDLDSSDKTRWWVRYNEEK
jgi:hypothetical protein